MGISVSIPISRGLRLGLDPVYQRIGISDSGYSLVFQTGVGSAVGEVAGKNATTANRWRLPVLVEAGLSRHVRLGLGPGVSIVTGSRNTFEIRNPFTGYRSGRADYLRPVRPALFGIGAALEFPFRFSKIVIAPGVHYHHWTGKHYGGIWSPDEVSSGIAIRM